MSIVLLGSTSGSITLQEPAVAGTNTLSLPAVTGTFVVAGQNSAITAATAVASTSGTSVDFTGIPSWVKRITVMFDGVSTNGTSNMVVRIGSGSVSTSGYTTATPFFGGANNTAIIAYTDGWNLAGIAAAGVIRGAFTLNLLNSATNAWVGTASFITLVLLMECFPLEISALLAH